MSDARDTTTARTPVERLVEQDVRDDPNRGRPLSSHTTQYQRTLEGYLQAGNRPRWMERLAEIDRGVALASKQLEAAFRRLREECGPDGEAFTRRWRETARTWDARAHNELVRQHNEWYPIERQLPVNPYTGEFVAIHGRSFVRPAIDADWILERFPD